MKQSSPRASYDHLRNFLLENKFQREQVDKNPFNKKTEHGILIVQIYIDDIIFSATNKSLCKDFSEMMQNEFKMSMMRELGYFIGIQIKRITTTELKVILKIASLSLVHLNLLFLGNHVVTVYLLPS